MSAFLSGFAEAEYEQPHLQALVENQKVEKLLLKALG